MKKQIYSAIAISVVLLLISSILNSCIKEVIFAKATVETSQVTSVTEATAISGGVVTSDGGSNISVRGVCWNISPYPTIENDTTTEVVGTGPFTSLIKGLSPSTTYYVRAYAINKGGTSYGLQMMFTTKTYSITTTPVAISLITATSAIGGGSIISDGDSSSLTVVARGVCWNTFPSPTIDNSKTTNGVGGGRFASNIDSLVAFTTYYVRAYATNGNGTIYGNEVSFTTQSGIISLTTSAISSTTAFTTTCGGVITADGGAPVLSRGVCWSTSSNPTIANGKTTDGSGTGTFVSNITGLIPGTTFFIRSYATNSVGTSYGNEISVSSLNGVVGLTTSAATTISTISAACGGNISSDGGSAVLSRGVCWNIFPNPTIENSKTTNGNGLGLFSSIISDLTPFTTYFVKAYATNSVGTSYGNEVNLTTLSGIIGLTTATVSSITAYTATSGGTITSDGGASITTRGICWNTSPSPTTANNRTVNGSGIGPFAVNITGLSPSTTYYVRSYGINSVGTSYGNEVSFIASNGVIGLTTATVSSITAYTATSGGTITSDGGAPVLSRGVCWSTSSNPTIANGKTTDGSGTGTFVSNIFGLTPATTYFIRSYATNSVGTSYGTEVSISSLNGVVGLTTTPATSITTMSANCGGNISSDGGATVTARGICWNTSQNPTTANNKIASGSGIGSFAVNITGLSPSTTYYARTYATNSVGTNYGNEVSFKTLAAIGTVTDVDGNIYNYITIGTQTWMVENLKTTKYNDGTSIPNVIDGTAWSNLTTPAYCWYNNNVANKNIYGALYNWYTASKSRLAPTGWHVPSDAEWTTLTTYLTNNGYGYGGSGSDIAKSMASTSGWSSSSTVGTVGNDQGSNNSSDFTGLSAGFRATFDGSGTFYYIGINGSWWSSTSYDTPNALLRDLNYDKYNVDRMTGMKNYGWSVRCLRDI